MIHSSNKESLSIKFSIISHVCSLLCNGYIQGNTNAFFHGRLIINLMFYFIKYQYSLFRENIRYLTNVFVEKFYEDNVAVYAET